MKTTLTTRFIIRVVLVVGVAGVILLAARLGAFAHLAEPRVLARSLRATGSVGYVGFVVSYAILQPFGVPGTVFIVAAPFVWPWKIAFALSMTGTMAASIIGFSFARFIARDWVSSRIPVRFHRYDSMLEKNELWAVFVLRLVFWMPQVLHFFLGVSRIRFWTHFWGSLLGYAPPLFVVSYFSSEMFDASGQMKNEAWPILGAMLMASLLIAVAARAWETRRS